jgi:hypothetical protein
MSSFNSRTINQRTAAAYGTRYAAAVRNTGTNIAPDPSSTPTSSTTNSSTLTSRYINYIADIINIILNVRNTSQTDLQGILTTLVGYQQLLSDYYSVAVDPTINNYDTVYYQIRYNDPFIYFLFFAYNLCDYQIIQYELITSVNNSNQRYANLLNATKNNGYSFNNQMSINLSINTGIKLEYLSYIKYYGLPNKGYFIPSILERIRLQVITDQNYTQFNPMTLNLLDPVYQEWVNPTAINPVLGTNETVTTTTDTVTGKTTTTIIDKDDSGNVLSNITIVV